MRTSVEGIMYPVDACSSISFVDCACSDHQLDKFVYCVPHAAWSVCSSALSSVFGSLRGRSFPSVFVLGPLHKGPIGDAVDAIYAPVDGVLAGTDWSVPLSVPSVVSDLVVRSDDVCSEECSLEIVAPYLSLLFPGVPVCYLLGCSLGSCSFVVDILRRNFPSSLFLISNNDKTNCAFMWKEAFSI